MAPVSEAARTAPPPRLGETAQFDAALARADPDARRLEAGGRRPGRPRGGAARPRGGARRRRSSIPRSARGSRPPAPDGTNRCDAALSDAASRAAASPPAAQGRRTMNSIIYLVGLIVIVMAILSLVGLA